MVGVFILYRLLYYYMFCVKGMFGYSELVLYTERESDDGN